MRHWLLFFLLVNLVCDMPGGPNVGSRYAAICSMGVDQTFHIDRYRDMTADWVRTPDGHYYSNKAPGPALLALPFFLAADPWMTLGTDTREEADDRRLAFGHFHKYLLTSGHFAFSYARYSRAAFYFGQGLTFPAFTFQGHRNALRPLVFKPRDTFFRRFRIKDTMILQKA